MVCFPTSLAWSIGRIDSTTRTRRTGLGADGRPQAAQTGRCACGSPLACAFSHPLEAVPCVAGAAPLGMLAYEAGIERTIVTMPEAANKQMEIPAIHIGTRRGRTKCVHILQFLFGVRCDKQSSSGGLFHRKCANVRTSLPGANIIETIQDES
jgi:hypothetical protein